MIGSGAPLGTHSMFACCIQSVYSMSNVLISLVADQPWIENELHPKAVSRDAGLLPGQEDFYSYATCGNRLFGGYRR
jgi:hypothetical protein